MRRTRTLHIAQIGYWVEDWSKRHTEYSRLENNCQHFVRDMVAHFNTDKALDLNGLMDIQSGSTLIPGLLASHGISQFSRTFEEWNASQKIKCVGLKLNKKMESQMRTVTSQNNDNEKTKSDQKESQEDRPSQKPTFNDPTINVGLKAEQTLHSINQV